MVFTSRQMCQNTVPQTTRALFLGGGGVPQLKMDITFKLMNAKCQNCYLN
jgi:hypothetical protein